MDWITTSTILNDLRDFRNAAAWQSFVDRFRRPVASFVHRLGIPDTDAEDVAQDALVAFAEAYRGGRYEPSKGRLSSWLFGIAYHQALRHRRRMGRRERTAPGDPGSRPWWDDIPDEGAAARLWDRMWDRFLVGECLSRIREELSPEAWRVFELVVVEDMKPNEAARELGVAVKTVYNRKHRILKRIRELRAELEELEEGGDDAMS